MQTSRIWGTLCYTVSTLRKVIEKTNIMYLSKYSSRAAIYRRHPTPPSRSEEPHIGVAKRVDDGIARDKKAPHHERHQRYCPRLYR